MGVLAGLRWRSVLIACGDDPPNPPRRVGPIATDRPYRVHVPERAAAGGPPWIGGVIPDVVTAVAFPSPRGKVAAAGRPRTEGASRDVIYRPRRC